MRVPEIKTYLTLWETLGTRPSRLAWGEIYLGLKTGVVEAAEGRSPRPIPPSSMRRRRTSSAPTI
jgi:TRAP-type C4-dicarboxylate transport system substrate-binding protein